MMMIVNDNDFHKNKNLKTERIVFTDPNGYVVEFLSLIAIHFYFNPIWFKNLNFIFHSHHYSDDDDDKMPTMKSNLHLMIIM